MTVQARLMVEAAAWPELPDAAAARRLEETAAAALEHHVPGVRQARGRLIAALPSPAPTRE